MVQSLEIPSKVTFKHFNMTDFEFVEVKRKGTKEKSSNQNMKIKESNYVRKMKRTKDFYNHRRSEESMVQDLEKKQIEFLQLFKKDYSVK